MIQCDLCEYQFKTFPKIEIEYEERREYEVTKHYPIPEENAHLVSGYICDTCYNKIGDIVKDLLLKSGEKYIQDLSIRKNNAYEKYLKRILELEEENKTVEYYFQKLKSVNNIFELDADTINALKYSGVYPYAIKGTYYLEQAINIEKQTKLNMKRITDWSDIYNIKIKKLPQDQSCYNIVNKEDFKKIIMDSEIENMTVKQMYNFLCDMEAI